LDADVESASAEESANVWQRLEWRQYQCCRLDGLPHQIEAIPFQPIQSFPNLRRVSLAVRRKTDPISHALEQRNTQNASNRPI
jgi:hypothetical protein